MYLLKLFMTVLKWRQFKKDPGSFRLINFLELECMLEEGRKGQVFKIKALPLELLNMYRQHRDLVLLGTEYVDTKDEINCYMLW